jgi:hypothetical protein
MKILRPGVVRKTYLVECEDCAAVFEFHENEAAKVGDALTITCPTEGCGKVITIKSVSLIVNGVHHVSPETAKQVLPPMVNGVVQVGPPPPSYDRPAETPSNKATSHKPWTPKVSEI